MINLLIPLIEEPLKQEKLLLLEEQDIRKEQDDFLHFKQDIRSCQINVSKNGLLHIFWCSKSPYISKQYLEVKQDSSFISRTSIKQLVSFLLLSRKEQDPISEDGSILFNTMINI
jgi:hypothetical protein